MTPYITRIDLYPIKSLDGVTVSAATLLPSGALQHDRAFALVDASGRFINGKREARIHQVRSHFSADLSTITLQTATVDQPSTFHIQRQRSSLEAWFSDYFQQPVTLVHHPEMGFPDDTKAPGPTVISTATLQTVAEWFGLSLAETRRRFRSNLEVDGVPPFWEDTLFPVEDDVTSFQIGTVLFEGSNPCQRCIVPTRDSQTGAATPAFQRQFSQQRATRLPTGTVRSRFKHFYYLAINTRLSPMTMGYSLQVGDPVVGP